MYIPAFTLRFKGKLYKITDHGSKHMFDAEDVLSGEIKTLKIGNYSKGSGNEHLIGSLEEVASSAIAGKAINIFEEMHGLPITNFSEGGTQ